MRGSERIESTKSSLVRSGVANVTSVPSGPPRARPPGGRPGLIPVEPENSLAFERSYECPERAFRPVADRPTYDEKLERILRESAVIFAEKGYHKASIRDIASATDVSLSGLYYYFKSKEELLFLIQSHCFDTLLQRLEESLRSVEDPAARLRVLIRNHLRFFVGNMKEMKVLSHEADGLSGEYRKQVTDLKRRYAELVAGILEELRPPGSTVDLRAATFSLFGMMNWIYTWYRPDRDEGVEDLADDMTHLFLTGFLSEKSRETASDVAEEDPDPSIWRSDRS